MERGEMKHEAADQLAKVAEVLRDENMRRGFASDPRATLQQGGVDPDRLPSGAVDMLAGLSPQEVGLLMRLNDRMMKAGLVVEGPNGGRVSFF